ncbi:MAG TPA: hypothetical protein VHB21_27810 [Minicystis sp.]|nr:hypothetical protein [Minicystis sp.]
MNTRLLLRPLPALLLASAGVLALACSSNEPEAKSAAQAQEKRDTEMKHEPCDPSSSGAQKVDINGDGKPDIVHVMSGGKEVCRIVDLNFDGAVDAYIYYDDQGRERRRESDYDRDGRADEIDLFKDGHLYLKLRETNFDNKIDTWDYYENDRLVRRERDSDGDGYIDQWWTFNDPANPKCATVATDRNGTGKPDPNSVVDLCADQYGGGTKAAPTSSAAAKSSAAPATSAAPSAAPAAAPPAPAPSAKPAAAPAPPKKK